VPLQIGSGDHGLPAYQRASFWAPPSRWISCSRVPRGWGAAQAGWTAYSPLARTLAPAWTCWIIAVILLGTSSIIGAANFLVTLFRMRAPA